LFEIPLISRNQSVFKVTARVRGFAE